MIYLAKTVVKFQWSHFRVGWLLTFSVGFSHRNFPLLSGIVFEFVSRPKRWLASGSVAAS